MKIKSTIVKMDKNNRISLPREWVKELQEKEEFTKLFRCIVHEDLATITPIFEIKKTE